MDEMGVRFSPTPPFFAKATNSRPFQQIWFAVRGFIIIKNAKNALHSLGDGWAIFIFAKATNGRPFQQIWFAVRGFIIIKNAKNALHSLGEVGYSTEIDLDKIKI